jgi:hypothetical protein
MIQIDPIDPIIMGHNQFFGVDHLSVSRGSDKEKHFSNLQNVLDLVRYAMQTGASGLMLSTHSNAPLILKGINQDPELKDKLNLYPLLPHISKYVRRSNEKGIINMILDTLSGTGFVKKLKLMLSGGRGLIKKDISTFLKTLIDVELFPFNNMRIKAVFLHDVLTDLALGLDLETIFELYIRHITENFGATPAFATKNLPLLIKKFSTYGIKTPLLLTHINKVGFQMNPSRQACEAALEKYDLKVIAMGTLASGYLAPLEAYEYLFKLPSIKSIVVGISTKAHAKETFEIIKSYIKSSS